MPSNNPAMRRIADLLRAKGAVSKVEILRHLGWTPKQRTLSWTALRRQRKRIAREDANSPDVVLEFTSTTHDRTRRRGG
jgi:hypothetical protein